MPLLDSKQQLHSFYVLVLFKQRITGSRITRVMRKYGRTELICAFCLALTSVTGGPFEFNFFCNFNIINLTGELARQSDPEFPSAHSPGALYANRPITIILKKVSFTILLSVFAYSFLTAQVWDKTNGCITDTLNETEAVFTRFTSEPQFKGNMKWFLTKNISLDIFLHSMSPNDTIFTDTARIQFIVSKKGEISNVTISKVKSQIFRSEVLRLFRLSSCSWEKGDQGGRYVNGWAQFEIYISVIRKYGEIKSNIDYKQIVPVDL